MIKTILQALGYSALALSIIGFFEIALGFLRANSYNLLRALIYSLLFGIGLALILR